MRNAVLNRQWAHWLSVIVPDAWPTVSDVAALNAPARADALARVQTERTAYFGLGDHAWRQDRRPPYES